MCKVSETASSPWVSKEWGPEPHVANVRQTRVMAGWTVELTSPEVMGGAEETGEDTRQDTVVSSH